MSDHFSGPRALADPAADISDVFAFPSPEGTKHLGLVMNVFSKAGPTALFSDAVIYRFRVRPVNIVATGPGAAFAVGSDEVSFDCLFDVPADSKDHEHPIQQARCTISTGQVVSFRVNDEDGGAAEGLRVFAGQRSDPFFLDVRMIEKTVASRKLAFKKVGSDTLYGTNVLSIVLKVDWAEVLKGGPMFAVVCETLAAGKRPVRIERLGRPEIKNVTLSWKEFDRTNRNLEIRDLYNSEDAFHVSSDYIEAYRARFNANLAFFDTLDGKVDWPLDEHGSHPLTNLLLADFLVIDLSKEFRETSYFEIEQSMLKDTAHVTPGGRWLNEDLMDSLFTLYINAGNGPRISDGVDAPIVWSSKVFPYLAPPNPPKAKLL
jgi:Domain of unknown function (DUF4331)